MGSFSATCTVSDIDVSSGDPIVMIMLAKNRYYKETNDLGVLYPSGEWGPVGLPIYGKYDDYGGIDSIEENAATAFTLSLIQTLLVDPDGDDELAEPQMLTLGELLDREINGRFIRVRGDKLNLKRMIVHRHVYEFLVHHQKYEGHDRDNDYKSFVASGPALTRESYRKLLADKRAKMAEYTANGMSAMQAAGLTSLCDYEIHRNIWGGEGQQFIGGEELLAHDEELFLEEWPKVQSVHRSLMYLRKPYRPMNTIGEQYTPATRYADFHAAVQEVVKTKLADEEKWASEDADESDDTESNN
jgi:hypothetical protein